MTGVTLLPLLGVLSSLTGCGTPDYGLSVHDDAGAVLDWIETTDATAIQISFDAAFQRTNYGADIGRCQVQLAFLLEWEDDGMGSDTDEQNQHEGEEGERRPQGPPGPQAHGELEIIYAQHGGELGLPGEPGECVLSIYDYDGEYHNEHGERGEGEGEGEHPEGERGERPEDGGEPQERHEGPSEGAWMVRGSIDLGPEVLLVGSEEDVWLDRTVDEEGRFFYELQPCDESTFPFAQTFDLAIPHTIEDELGELMVSEAFAIGPELTLLRPGEELTDRGVLEHPQDKPLSIAWELQDDMPEMNGEQIGEELMIWIHTQRREDWRFEEALACKPYHHLDHFLIPPEFFAEMKSDEPGVKDPIYESSFQVDLRGRSEPVDIDWAEIGRVSSTVTEGGLFRVESASP